MILSHSFYDEDDTMCGGGARRNRQPLAPEAPVAPDTGASEAEMDTRRRRQRSAGGTILTSARGVQDGGATVGNTLLGQ